MSSDNEVVNESDVDMGDDGSQIDDDSSSNGDEADTEAAPPQISDCNMTEALTVWEKNHTVQRYDPVPILIR